MADIKDDHLPWDSDCRDSRVHKSIKDMLGNLGSAFGTNCYIATDAHIHDSTLLHNIRKIAISRAGCFYNIATRQKCGFF